ncbi:heme A synthase [Fulvivirga sp. M361]|uniref:COX15/CtaA family protein n=1 Tax=Fulvivirga sp. M361 TaxID=2594266 RepID=UPI00117998A6|nr:COX15/CtaA family protein [Fulvivirga sp. M361]TRX61733.1 heme A synthase [Fulvivirga sp. M361]
MKNREFKQIRLFRRISLITLVAVYLLILVGGIVRSSGSGMGCPDWPKCFGSWVPPTSKEQLPPDYKDIYSAKRDNKNKRFASYLTTLGFRETADKLLADKSILEEADFNKYKTWIEYINRLIGAIIGLLIIATFVASIPFFKSDKKITITSFSILLLVLFQGWIGSIVVSTNLLPWMITIHMFLALLIVALLIYVYHSISSKHIASDPHQKTYWLKLLLIGCMLTSLIQIAFGTQVRESVDHVASSLLYQSRETWIGELGVEFFVHRSFSWVVFLLHVILIYLFRKSQVKSKLVTYLIVILLVSLLSGVIMAYWAIPPTMQPVHLLVGTLGFGIQFLLFLRLNRNNAVLT